jgi:hypothetical protein
MYGLLEYTQIMNNRAEETEFLILGLKETYFET